MPVIFKTKPTEKDDTTVTVEFDEGEWITIKQESDLVVMTPVEVFGMAGALISHLLDNGESEHYAAIAALHREMRQVISFGPAGVYGIFADDIVYAMAGVKVGLPDPHPIK